MTAIITRYIFSFSYIFFFCWYACCLLVIFNICRTNSYVYSFPPKSKTCKDDSAQTSTSSIPRHTLRSFNYLMQDAGIMLGRHLKGASAFIYWDGSSVRRKEKRSAWLAQRLFMVSSKVHLSMSSSSSVFAFQFLSLFGLPGSSALCIPTFFPPLLHRGGIRGPFRRPRVTGRVGRSTWGEATTVISHFSACCSQVYASGTCCTASSFFLPSLFFFFSERFCQKHKDWEHQYRWHSEWSIYLVKLKKLHE